MLPAFAPKPIDAYEPYTRALCNELLDATAGKTEIDAAVDYAQDIPLRVIAKMLGFPESDADIFRRFIRMIIEDVGATAEERQAQIEGGELVDGDELMALATLHLRDSGRLIGNGVAVTLTSSNLGAGILAQQFFSTSTVTPGAMRWSIASMVRPCTPDQNTCAARI